MIERTHESMMTARVEACFRDMLLSVAAGRLACSHGRRREILDHIRTVKGKAIEAEVLLRALDRRVPASRQLEEFAGVAQPARAPDASHQEVESSNPSPRSTALAREVL